MFTLKDRVKILIVTCIALFMAMLDNLVIGVALPSIQSSLNVNLSDLQWFLNAYTLVFAVLLIPFSILGERYGRKKVFLIGILFFTLGSLASAQSESALQLSLSRAVQGVGSAAIMPLSLTIINFSFPKQQRAAAIGIWSGISGLGLSVGPLVGGIILEGAPWEMIFWINVPIGIVAIISGMLWLRESKGTRKPIDPIGIALLGLGLFGVVFGLVRGNPEGWGAWSVWGAMLMGGLFLFGFICWEMRQKQPMIKLAYFKRKPYTAYISTGFWLNAGIFGAIFLLTLFLQQAQGYSALEAGIREMAWTTCTMISAPIAGLLAGRFGSRKILLMGLLLQTIAIALIAVIILEKGAVFPFGFLLPTMIMGGIGMGLSFTPLSHGVLTSVPESVADEASGISNAMKELGGVFGVAIGGTIFESGGMITSAASFGDHLIPALFALAGMLAVGVVTIGLFGGLKHSGDKRSLSRDSNTSPEMANI